MKKSIEMKKKINKLRNEITEAQKDEDLAKAAELAAELREVTKKYEVQKALEESETPDNDADDDDDDENDDETDTKNHSAYVPVNQISKEKMSRLRNRAFNKLLFGKKKFGRMTEEERQAYYNEDSGTTTTPATIGQIGDTPSKGGYIVPIEQMNILREYRKAYTALKEYCHVVNAQSRSGSFPTLGDEDGLLINFSEMNKIKESDFDFGQSDYTIFDYGDIIPVSNTLIQDANVQILEIVGQRLTRKAVNTENAKILELLSTLTATPITNYKGLTKALNVSLDPVYYAGAKIITNQDGFQWLSELEDDNKRPLLLPDITTADTYKFRGKEIIVLPNSQLKTVSKKVPMYVGNLADYCMFFERQSVEIAISTEYKFGLNATSLRCITRFGVTKDDTDAMVKLEITIS